ncbi:PspA/IM30 family protein [Mesorhizobium sp. M4B.F.Ca.ET.215.01.1.1]|uniref:PspA/IM30 family protein n=1 Tax=unclassified Mesorhizobium TaxID=325217 RepID=UPI000FCBD5FA|nr:MULTISPECIES: PspA/IM30 family protein [unclassified Mesorhizobium]RUW23257.1 PspA/IM30 family protein [Mesorhizobium sp. M4B.F.Ca.ET.013.02.1.1]RVD43619.1 PspA/IM30 family protein [Mesorhizobium sp. M4B.F.Ca.ET.019.03.1.1]TGQ04422.1 PspA/IM30 family protein [Mesorhizobium sp. M4B.F.Ca.ET.215.01.1.1]TGQ26856.1 PspA/IM30 family protein [Mesorhizobium sp. M00.F.Ca.ET.220.01.1.1]TGQ34421.1 PspA/IM30 family protein [Mesorhizobium sp. M4B.F.Ca.ET.214.01.1.1]
MLSLLRTLLDGAGAKAEDRLKDQFAVDLLAQRIRDAEAGLACAKQTLASLIVRQRAEQASLDQLDRRIADLETRTRSALAAGAEALAHDGASAIAELENEREVRRTTVRSLTEKTLRMRLSLEQAHRRIVDLNQGMISARAIDAEQKAQRRLNRSIGRTASLNEAEALLARIRERSDPFEEASILDEIDAGLSQEAIRGKLEEAGHGPSTKVRAQDVLERLKSTH